MARPHKPRYSKARKAWFVEIDGQQRSLGPDEEEAMRQYHLLMAGEPQQQSLELEIILQKFLDWVKVHRPKSLRWYGDFCESFLDYCGDVLAEDIRPHDVEKWSNKGKSKRGKITAIKRAFNWAVKEGLLKTSPIAHMERPPTGRTTQIVTEEDLTQILSHVRDQNFKDLLIVSWDCGCRPHETKIVEAKHIEFHKHRWLLPLEMEKKKRRPRIVYMTERAEEIVRRLAKKYPSGPIFRNTHEKPWTAANVKDRFKRLEDKIGKRFTQYAFRHSWTTRMIAAGIDSHVVAVLAGHSNTAMIDLVYSHIEHQHDFLLKQIRNANAASSDEAGGTDEQTPQDPPD